MSVAAVLQYEFRYCLYAAVHHKEHLLLQAGVNDFLLWIQFSMCSTKHAYNRACLQHEHTIDIPK